MLTPRASASTSSGWAYSRSIRSRTRRSRARSRRCSASAGLLVTCVFYPDTRHRVVSTELQGQGFTVLTPPNLLRGVAGDAAYVASFFAQRTTGPVVLVAHSYGGVVITNAGTGGGDVKALVYIDAFIPEVGENVFQILGGSGSALDVPDPTAVLDLAGYPGAPEGDVEAFLKPDTVLNSFAQDLPEADRWLIAAGQRPITLGANSTPSGPGAWKSLPSWVVIGTEDRVIPPDT